MIWYRSNGRIPKGTNQREVLGNEVDTEKRRFWKDHELIAPVARNNTSVDDHPERIVFGLPHNYFFSSTYDHAGVRPASAERRASPLLMHIHEFGDRPVAALAFMPARFLPESDQVRVQHSTVDLDRSEEFWSPIEEFLERLESPEFTTNAFSRITKVDV